jgi:antitoxin (DNA-binding transcriptional repressor) of toxin-antitoxin stability system
MITISIHDVMQDLSGCLQKVERGETFVIIQDDKPVAELKPVFTSPTGPRPFGLCAGEFRVPDDFDAPLPEDIIGQFEGA